MTENGANSVPVAEGTQPPAGTADAQAADAADVQSSQPAMSLDQAIREIRELRRENATHRTRLKKFEEDATAAEAAKLTDLERTSKERDALAESLKAAEGQIARMRIESAVGSAAQKAGFVNPADALGFIDGSRIESGDDGMPRNIDALVAEVAKARPYLLASQTARSTGSFDTGSGPRPSSSREQQLAGLNGKALLDAIRSRA